MSILSKIGDSLWGPGPDKPNTSKDEAANKALIEELRGQVPGTYYDQTYQGDFTPTQLADTPQIGQSEMAGITTDPRERDAQYAALNSLQEQSNEGLTGQDRADLAGIEDRANSMNRGRQEAIAQNFAARGMSGSGNELVQANMAAQGAANQQYQAGLQKAAMSENNKRAAVAALGQLGGQMQGQEFGQKAQQASAQDAINKFNTANTIGANQFNAAAQNQAGMRNADARQGVASAQANGQNQFNQNQFQNRAQVAQVGYNANTGNINNQREDYQNDVNAKNSTKNALIGAAAGVGAAYMKSDENSKKDIKTMSSNDIEDFLNSLQPKKFKYKDDSDGSGNRVGVLAQDVERSKMGKDLVKDGPDGKALDINNTIGALLDSVAHLHRKMRG